MKKISQHIRKKIITVSIILLSVHFSFGQDIHFSQFFETPLLRNPGLAGIYTGDVRIQSVHRSQWNSFTTAYQTTSLNAETKLKVRESSDDYLTLGAQVLFDKAGTTNFKSIHTLPVVNYHKSLSYDKNRYLSVGFMGGYVNRNIDRSKITTNNQWGSGGYDPNLPDGETFANPGYRFWDLTAGISYNSNIGETDENNYYVGLAYHHINKPKVGFYEGSKMPLSGKVVVNAGLKYHFGEDSYITTQADYSKQGSHTEIIMGMTYSMNLVNGYKETQYALHTGLYMRWKDALIPFVKLDKAPFSVSFSYDINMSTLRNISRGRGGFEVSLAYLAFKPKGNSSLDAVRCPRF